MKRSTIKTLVILAIIIITLVLPIPPFARFGIPFLIILYLLYTGRGTIWYLMGLRAGRNRDHDKILKFMLKASKARVSVERGCIAAVTLLKHDKIEDAEQLFATLALMNNSTLPKEIINILSSSALLGKREKKRKLSSILGEFTKPKMNNTELPRG